MFFLLKNKFLNDIFTDFDGDRCKFIGGPDLGERAENGERFWIVQKDLLLINFYFLH